MRSAITVFGYEQACARDRWKVRDCFIIATDACAFSCFTGRVWAFTGGEVS